MARSGAEQRYRGSSNAIEHKVNIDAGDFAGLTALSHAAGHSNLPMMRMLLAKGANVNIALKREIKVRNGVIAASHITPLMASAGGSSPEAVKAPLGAGAAVNLSDVRGMTPLILEEEFSRRVNRRTRRPSSRR